MTAFFELQAVSCYLCGTDDADEWARSNGYRAVKCRGCGLVYVSPRPCDSAISVAHQTGEHRTEHGTIDVTTSFSRRAVSAKARMLTTLFGDAWVGSSRPRAWLDVGAGNGELLLAVRSVLGEGIDLRGVEPNRHKRRHAADRGIELFEDLTHVVDRHFDVISLVDVYSHIADPPQFLRRLAQQLGERGSFFIVTGNGGDLASREQYPDELDLPDHLSFVGRDQLVGLMRELGFVATRIVEKRHDTLRRVARNVRRWLCGTRACVTLPYTSPFRSMWCRFDRAPS